MDPSIYDTSSPWSNLWLISSALFAIVWTLTIAAPGRGLNDEKTRGHPLR